MKRRQSVESFADAMEEVLQENDHKPHWGTLSLAYLRERLNEELEELDRALIALDEVKRLGTAIPLTLDGLKQNARREAIDVANFIMMIWEKVAEETARPRK